MGEWANFLVRKNCTESWLTRCTSVATKTHIFPGLPHGFRLFTELPSSRRWDDLTLEIIAWILADDNKSGNQNEGQFTVEDTTTA